LAPQTVSNSPHNIQYCPPAHATAPARRAPIARSAQWPRLYAQLIATGDTFELARGPVASEESTRRYHTLESGPAWRVWIEHKVRQGTSCGASE
jgi:hypothetical protein